MKTLALLCLALAFVSADQKRYQKIVGGTVTNISRYPYGVVILHSFSGSGTFLQHCGGSIINNRSVLTAAHCLYRYYAPYQIRLRVGSSFASSGGVLHNSALFILHPQYNDDILDNDVALIQTNVAFSFNANVARAAIASSTYWLPDNTAVWAIGWGMISGSGPGSEQLREVQLYTINQSICANRYREINNFVTQNMVCVGILDVGGRDQCGGDSGGPLLHNNVVVGVCSWGHVQCGHPRYPGVNAIVSRYTSWIESNA